MAARYIDPEDHGRQTMPPERNASISMSMLDPMNQESPLSLIRMHLELIALQKRLDEQLVYHRRFTFALAALVCTSIGLLVMSFLQTFG